MGQHSSRSGSHSRITTAARQTCKKTDITYHQTNAINETERTTESIFEDIRNNYKTSLRRDKHKFESRTWSQFYAGSCEERRCDLTRPRKKEKPLDPPAPPPCPVSDKRWTTGRTANVTAVKRMKIQCSALASLRDRITWRALRHILKKLPELRRSS